MVETPTSVPGVADVEILRGARAPEGAVPDLLVEVPHGADRRSHYDALRGALVGELPDELELFFHANTDLGAWDYGRRVAVRVLEQAPERTACVVRCLLPRTFVDTNRLPEAPDELAKGGLTAGVPVYVRDPRDRALLLARHRAYVALAEEAHALVLDAGGFALLPHTYGPRTMGIAGVDDRIVDALRAAYAPGTWESWPLRPEVDLITKDPDGRSHAEEILVREVLDGLARAGFEALDSRTYTLHPSTQGARFATRYPGQTLCLEVRRDLLVERFHLFEELTVDPARVSRVAAPLADAIGRWLDRRDS